MECRPRTAYSPKSAMSSSAWLGLGLRVRARLRVGLGLELGFGLGLRLLRVSGRDLPISPYISLHLPTSP